jgi:hypothetical protein
MRCDGFGCWRLLGGDGLRLLRDDGLGRLHGDDFGLLGGDRFEVLDEIRLERRLFGDHGLRLFRHERGRFLGDDGLGLRLLGDHWLGLRLGRRKERLRLLRHDGLDVDVGRGDRFRFEVVGGILVPRHDAEVPTLRLDGLGNEGLGFFGRDRGGFFGCDVLGLELELSGRPG